MEASRLIYPDKYPLGPVFCTKRVFAPSKPMYIYPLTHEY